MSDAAADTIVSHFGPEWERIDPYVWLHRGLNAMRVGRRGGTRVSLASVVLNGRVHGRTPEQTAEDYDLSVEDVRGALAWAEAHPEEVKQYMEDEEATFDRLRQASERENPSLYARLREARRRIEAGEPVEEVARHLRESRRQEVEA